MGTWREDVSHVFGGLDIVQQEPFTEGTIDGVGVSRARLWQVRASAQRISWRLVSPEPRGFVSLVVQLEGQAVLEQGRRTCELGPESLTFIDGASPATVYFPGRFRQLLVLLPRAAFPAALEATVAVRMDASHPVDRLLFEHVRHLPEAVPFMGPLQQDAALDALLALSRLSTAFQRRTDERLPVRVERAMALIEQELGDAELTPERVAASQGVSRRYLDELFARQGGRIEGWIWERRLLRAAQRLRDPEHRGRSVLEIALDHGFREPAHFSRAFKRRFGKTPSAWRREADAPRLSAGAPG